MYDAGLNLVGMISVAIWSSAVALGGVGLSAVVARRLTRP
jgi:hypothetical protein